MNQSKAVNDMPEYLADAIQDDGSLYRIEGEYISWSLGNKTVHIDGLFTPEQLRAIADYMDRTTHEHRQANRAQKAPDRP